MPNPHGAGIVPCLLYRDAPSAIEWLCHAFGFEKHMIVDNTDGTIAHAQLSLGNGMIMIGSVGDTPYGKLIRQPDQVGGLATQSIYVVVPDADVVYQRVKATAGEIVLDIKDEEYGGRGFTCRDPEGHLWNVGSYDPWQ
ncbi:VOC family protein [Cupriavidus respiraculi]|nr:VOC family protein [Cupriavidus respiraculi]